jgi:hypothetical protein
MDKRVLFDSISSLGQCFAEAIDITPRGGGLEKIAGERHPEISRYIKELRPDPGYQFVLMTPMGSFEYWGINVNGDLFPDVSLSFDMDKGDPVAVAKRLEAKWLAPFGKTIPPGSYREFGFKTFLQAKRYRHHANKDPSVSYGDIVVSVWNPIMHRVEVIVRHDRETAKRVGAEDIIADIDAGKPRQISMGCKVPFDVCTKCGNISRTPGDYCDHLRLNMGGINPDGSINAAVNFFMRFFDLSDVFIPAAKEAGVLEKVARDRRYVVKAAVAKQAEIKKDVLPNSGYAALRQSYESEPDLPKTVLRGGSLENLLTTLSGLGIVMKPAEFQDAALSRMGMQNYSDDLASRGQVFHPETSRGDFTLDPKGFDSRLAEVLAPLLGERSGFYPHLPRRVLRITVIQERPAADLAPESEPLKKVAQVYDAYRRSLRNLPGLLEVAVRDHADYYNRHFFSELLTDSLVKTAGSLHASVLSFPAVPMYVYNAYRGTVSQVPASWELSTTSQSPARALLSPIL